MSKALKIVLALVALIFASILIFLVYLVNVDPNNHKNWITGRFQQETGRSLELTGPIELSFYPWLGVSLEQVTVGNAEGFGPEPMLEADSAAVRLKFLPLLRGQYEIDTVRVQGAHLNLEINEAGFSNWDDLAQGDGTEDAEETDSGELPLEDVVLGGVDVQRVSLTLTDRAADTRFDITDLSISTDELVYGEPIDLTMAFNAAASRPELAADVALTGTINYDLENERYRFAPLRLDGSLSGPGVAADQREFSLETAIDLDLAADGISMPELEIQALGTSLTASVEGRDVQSDSASYQAELQVRGSDLAALFRILEIEPLATDLAGLEDRAFALMTSVSADFGADSGSGNIDVSNLEASMLGASLNGNLLASEIQSENPVVRGRLSTSGPDLPLLFEVLGQLSGGGSSPLSQAGRDLAQFDSKAFSVEAEFDADFQNGNIEIPVLTASALGFELRGNVVTTDAAGGAGSIEGGLQLTGTRIQSLLRAFEQPDLAEVAREIHVELSLSGSPEQLIADPLSVRLVLAGPRIPDSPASIAFNGRTQLNLEQESLSMEAFTLTGLGLDVNGDLIAGNILSDPGFEGRISLAEFNLRSLLQQLNQEVPETADERVLERVALGGSFSGSTDSLTVEDFEAVLDDSNLNGRFSLADFESPAIEFALAIDQIDVDRYLPPETGEDDPDGQTENVELPLEQIRELNVNGEFGVGDLTLSGLRFSETSITFGAAGGRLSLSPFTSSLYEGSFDGDISLEVNGDTAVATVNANLEQITLEPLLQDFMDASYLSGRGNVQVSLAGEGADVDTLMSTLNGNGSIALEEGVLRGVDIAGVLRQVETMLRTRSVADIQRGQATPFENFSASLTIDEGIVRSEDLLIAAPGFQVTGRGILVDLADDSIDFGLVATVDESTASRGDEEFDIGGYSLPIGCTGTLDSPRCLPDVREIARNAISREAQRRVGDLLERALGREPSAEQDNGGGGDSSDSSRQPAEEDPVDELINRTLDRIFQ